MIRHVIFDCFGTLIDTGSGSIRAVERILSDVGSGAEPGAFYADWKRIRKRMMGGSVFRNEKTLFALSLAEVFEQYGIEADASAAVQPMIQSLFSERHAFQDVQPALRMLSEMGLDFAVGSTTDTDSLMYYLERNHLAFDRIYTSENMEVYKPDPRFYETILQRSGWRAEECLFVGDNSLDDVLGPKSVGMQAALLDRKGTYANRAMSPEPDYRLRAMTELAELLA